MKVGILSDSHDNLPALAKAVSLFNDAETALVIHAGDFVAPFVARPLKDLQSDFIGVFGNNDGERFGLVQAFGQKIFRPPHAFTFAGKKILLLHEPDNLDALVASNQFDMIIYGHTHDAEIHRGDTVVVNPGECGGWVNGRRTVALWEIETNEVEIIPV